MSLHLWELTRLNAYIQKVEKHWGERSVRKFEKYIISLKQNCSYLRLLTFDFSFFSVMYIS